MEQILAQKQKQHYLLAPQLQQSIQILQLPCLELKHLIEQEVENNPCLELQETGVGGQLEFRKDAYSALPLSNFDSDNENSYPARQFTLEEYLLRQMRLSFRDKGELQIGEFIIGSLNDNGYLKIDTAEIACFLNTDVSVVEKILQKIQAFDPVGCASRNVRECLLSQLKSKGKEGSAEYRIVGLHLDDLANKRYNLLAKRLNIGLEEVKLATKQIALLEPKPARQFSYSDNSIYIIPDIKVDSDAEGEYKVILNEKEFPLLRINSFYKSLLNRKNVSDEEKEFVRDRLSAGQAFIKSIQMRNETIRRLSEYVVKFQGEFLEKGKEYLKPLTLKEVAKGIRRDESTVSRTVNNKYIDTPQGIFRLRDLFSGEVNFSDTKESVSSASIKERIRALVENEDKLRPLSDEDILKKLQPRNLKLSRRTIAKYRNQLKILPSYLRKE